jgi:alanine dehydrogenase
VDGVVHYGVTNIPGAVSRTSSLALCNATLPYVRQLASLGVDAFAAVDAGRAAAINMAGHKLTNAAVAQAFPDLPGGD